MKKALSIALILLLTISVVANYQISFAAPDKDKDNNSNAIHLKDKNNPSKGNNPKVGNDDGSIVVGPDESYDLDSDSEDDNFEITQPGKNKGGVNKVELYDEDGKKINSKNFKDNETKDPKGEDPKGEEPEDEELKGEEPKGEEPKGEEPKGEEPKGEDPKGEEPKSEEPEDEEPKDENSEGNGTPNEQNIQTSTSTSFETTEIPNEQLLIPLGSPEITETTTITNEEVPESSPQAPAPATLPKTGNIDPISITGLGTAMLAIGILLQTKKK